MALPPEYRTPEVERLEAIMNATPFEQIATFPAPIRSDRELIGQYVFTYSFIDLNLRRSVEVFARRDMLSDEHKKRPRNIPAGQLAPAVRYVVERMPPEQENIPETLDILAAIDRGREMRNLLAHWGIKRFPTADALIMMTKDEQDAKRSGRTLSELGLATVVAYVADIRRALHDVAKRDEWLARRTSAWIERYVPEE
jgi:hypothetical protein